MCHALRALFESPCLKRAPLQRKKMLWNRQRCLIIGGNELRNHQQQKLTAATEASRPKRLA